MAYGLYNSWATVAVVRGVGSADGSALSCAQLGLPIVYLGRLLDWDQMLNSRAGFVLNPHDILLSIDILRVFASWFHYRMPRFLVLSGVFLTSFYPGTSYLTISDIVRILMTDETGNRYPFHVSTTSARRNFGTAFAEPSIQTSYSSLRPCGYL